MSIQYKMSVQYEYRAGEDCPYRCKITYVLPVDSDGLLPWQLRAKDTLAGCPLSADWGIRCPEGRTLFYDLVSSKSWDDLKDLVEDEFDGVFNFLREVYKSNLSNMDTMPMDSIRTRTLIP